MKQNNRKNTWKAIVAVMLVMATLFSISTMVSAGFVEEIFEEVCDMMTTSSSYFGGDCSGGHDYDRTWTGKKLCDIHNTFCDVTLKHCARCGRDVIVVKCEKQDSQN